MMMPPLTSTPGHFLTRSKSPSGAISSSTAAVAEHQQYNELLAEQSKQTEEMRSQLQLKLDETKASLDKLHAQFAKYKDDMLTTNRMLSEDVDTYRTG